MRITIVLAIFLWGSIFLASCGMVLAADEVGIARIDPSSPFYFLKIIRENWQIKFSQDNDTKVLKHLDFATSRIREVNSLVNKNKPDLIPPTLESYWANFSQINSYLRLTNKNLMNKVSGEISKHLVTLASIYEQLSDKRAKIFVRSTINRLSLENTLLLEKIAKITKEDPKIDLSQIKDDLIKNKSLTCDLLVKEASESGLNDVEKVVLGERAQQCLTNF